MTKKSTDASSILGAARRAAEVQRPIAEEELRILEKRINVALRPQTHKRLKLLSVQREMTVQDLAEELLQESLERHGV